MRSNVLRALSLAVLLGALLGSADLLRLAWWHPGSVPDPLGALGVLLRYEVAALVLLGVPVALLNLLSLLVRWGREAPSPALFLQVVAFGAGLLLAFHFGTLPDALARTEFTALATPPTGLLIALAVAAGTWLLAFPFGCFGRQRKPAGRIASVHLLAAAAVTAAACLGAPRLDAPLGPRPLASSQPNVVLVVLDTVRGDVFTEGLSDPKIAPRMADLAAEGTLYPGFEATSTWTLPTHASLFTGMMPRVHGARMPALTLSPDLRTLAEILRDRGYRTACITNNPWISEARGMVRGFDRVWEPRLWIRERPFLDTLVRRIEHQVRAPLRFGYAIGDKNSRYSLELARDWLDVAAGRGETGPFLLFVNLMNAHLPYLPPPEYVERFFEPGEPEPEAYGHIAGILEPDKNNSNRIRASGLRRLYRASVAYLDDVVGDFTDLLRQRGELDRTLLVVVSDHGENLGEYGELGHGGMPRRTTTSVPLLVRYPPLFEAGAVDARPASQVDLLPTVLEALGPGRSADLPYEIHGQSLRAEVPRPFVVSEFFGSPSTTKLAPGGAKDGVCLIEGEYRLLWTDRTGPRLYRTSAEGDGEVDVSDEEPERLREMSVRLDTWRAAIPPRAGTESHSIGDPEKAALQAMGYLVDPPAEPPDAESGAR